MTENDEYEVMRENSPWPKRNHNCFLHLNVFMERCNDVLELVQTMRHFQILSKTVSIGGTDNQNMDILAQEIHMKYTKALSQFQSNVVDVMNFDRKEQQFEMSFFRLRTTIKVRTRQLHSGFYFKAEIHFFLKSLGTGTRVVADSQSQHQAVHNHRLQVTAA